MPYLTAAPASLQTPKKVKTSGEGEKRILDSSQD